MKLAEIATRIDAHLKRFENDKAVNRPSKKGGCTPYYEACSWSSGNRVGVRYVSYQGNDFLTKTEALVYLEKLDEGFVGKHWVMLEK